MITGDATAYAFRDVILARAKPAAATPANLYSVPAGGATHILGMMICNASSGTDAARVSISPAGAATAAQDYLYFDLPFLANDTFLAEIDTTLKVSDTIRVQSASGNLVFALFGVSS